jgi:hypothetical protein
VVVSNKGDSFLVRFAVANRAVSHKRSAFSFLLFG